MKRNLSLVKSIFCAFTSCCLGFLFLVPVKAESDIYYPDPDSYMAYQYFFNHGYTHLTLTDSTAVTYNVDLDQDGTNNGTQYTDYTHHDTYDYSGRTTGTFNSNGSSTLGSRYMTCTSRNVSEGSTQTYSCYFSSTQTGVSNSQSINIGFNSNLSDSGSGNINVNEVIKQTIDTDIVGTITSTNSSKSYIYLPFLHGTYVHDTAYNSNSFFNVSSSHDSWLIFVTSKFNSSAAFNAYYGGSATAENFNITSSVMSLGNGLYMYKYHFQVAEGKPASNVTIDIPWLTNEDVLPIYCGRGDLMTDNIREKVGIETITHQYQREGNNILTTIKNVETQIRDIVVNGNNNSPDKYQEANRKNAELKGKISNFDTFENNAIGDMTDSLDSINTSPDIVGNSTFLVSARWVRTCFNQVTNNTPFGSVLSFSLLLGLGMIFLGKYR